MPNFKIALLGSIIFVFCLSANVMAEGMKLNPGLWEMKTILTMPFGAGTRENVNQECIKKSQVSPEELMNDVENCDVQSIEVTEESMKWSITCKKDDIDMTGEGHAQSTGTTIQGGMSFKAKVNEQDMEITTQWEGKHIGDCP